MNGATAVKMPDLVSRRAKMHYITALNELARSGVDISRVHLLAVGEFQNYAGEIRRQTPDPGTDLRADTQITLEIGAKSAVDIMPYQFFSGLEGYVPGHDWERKARCLMAPFDASVIRHDSWALYRILKLSFGYLDRAQLKDFLAVFDIDLPGDDLTDRELLLMAMLLPAYHEWAGNAESVSQAVELFFGYTTEIVESIPRRYEIPERLRYRLGDTGTKLGAETLLGDSFVECDSAYRLTLRGVAIDRVRDFLPGQPARRKLEWLLGIIMPNNLECEIRVRPRRERRRLAGEKRRSYLGYATYV